MSRITEKKRIKIDRECKDYPVFATWINTLGGREQWLFHKINTESINTESLGTFEPFVEDLETARGQIFDIGIFAQPKITCYGLIDSEDLEGLKSILYSPNIEVLVNPETWETEGVKWQVYRVETGSFRIIDSDEVRSEFEITFNKPYINNVSQ
jgi:hypothetical protein